MKTMSRLTARIKITSISIVKSNLKKKERRDYLKKKKQIRNVSKKYIFIMTSIYISLIDHIELPMKVR